MPPPQSFLYHRYPMRGYDLFSLHPLFFLTAKYFLNSLQPRVGWGGVLEARPVEEFYPEQDLLLLLLQVFFLNLTVASKTNCRHRCSPNRITVFGSAGSGGGGRGEGGARPV